MSSITFTTYLTYLGFVAHHQVNSLSPIIPFPYVQPQRNLPSFLPYLHDRLPASFTLLMYLYHPYIHALSYGPIRVRTLLYFTLLYFTLHV